ncbi:Methyltransferase-like protein 8 [Chelonia mydas]|uniref:Methyltransferase-like protein 8 n=1 Tax=Chelonia mydas TaxID=8469 RepID=M7BLA2_CHEMY|nr:Methyltransferase-like protein 8 [Chelonia mydas]
MNVIKRLSASYLRKSKMQQRCQSNRRPTAPLGSRILTDPTKVFEHNMWDHMQWSQEEEERAREKATENSLVRVQPEDQDKYEREASKYWNEFYKAHKNNFFKDRNWLFLEFPEILPKGKKDQMNKEEKYCCHVKLNATNNCTNVGFPAMFEEGEDCQNNLVDDLTSVQGHAYNKSQAEPVTDNKHVKNCEQEPVKQESFPGSGATYRILEVGCGAGNSAFPILKVICNIPGAFLYCCDFALGAVELVKSHLSYNSAWCSAFVHDVCDDSLPYPFPDEILDVILLVFVLSAIHPDRLTADAPPLTPPMLLTPVEYRSRRESARRSIYCICTMDRCTRHSGSIAPEPPARRMATGQCSGSIGTCGGFPGSRPPFLPLILSGVREVCLAPDPDSSTNPGADVQEMTPMDVVQVEEEEAGPPPV